MRPVEIMIATGGDPIAAAIGELIERDYPAGWKGSAWSLHCLLAAKVSDMVRYSGAWPTNANILAYHIESLAPALRRVGIVVLKRRGDDRFSIRRARPSAADNATGASMGFFTLTAAEAKALVDRCQTLSPLRAALDALRSNPGALVPPFTPSRSAAIAAQAPPFSRERILAAFAAAPPLWQIRSKELFANFARMEAAAGDRAVFPLRQAFAIREPRLNFAGLASERGAKPLDANTAPAALATRALVWAPDWPRCANAEQVSPVSRESILSAFAVAPPDWRRCANAEQASPISRESILAAFAVAPPTWRALSDDISAGLARLQTAGEGHRVFPLRRALGTQESAIDFASLIGGRGADLFDGETLCAGENVADADAQTDDDLLIELAAVARDMAELAKRVEALQRRQVLALGRDSDDDPLLAIGWVAKAFGKDAAAVTKQAKRRGLHVFVGGRVHVRLSDMTRLYPAMSGSALLASALAKCEARAKRG